MNLHEFKRGWTGGGMETLCGHGSKVSQTKIQREWIPAMVEKHNIRTIADIGAGDLNWMNHVVWPYPVEYQAFDLVPRHKSVKAFDLIHEIPPKADLIMCLWLLNHLPEENARAAIKNLWASGCKYLMYTWWNDLADYQDLGSLESTVMRSAYKGKRKIDYELRLLKC
ncbi:hypothetical protein N9937_01080 [bacterium]|nr:hypothetical protein [bacterium]